MFEYVCFNYMSCKRKIGSAIHSSKLDLLSSYYENIFQELCINMKYYLLCLTLCLFKSTTLFVLEMKVINMFNKYSPLVFGMFFTFMTLGKSSWLNLLQQKECTQRQDGWGEIVLDRGKWYREDGRGKLVPLLRGKRKWYEEMGVRDWSPPEKKKDNWGVGILCVLMMFNGTTVLDTTTTEIVHYLSNFGRYTYGSNYYCYLLKRTVGEGCYLYNSVVLYYA